MYMRKFTLGSRAFSHITRPAQWFSEKDRGKAHEKLDPASPHRVRRDLLTGALSATWSFHQRANYQNEVQAPARNDNGKLVVTFQAL